MVGPQEHLSTGWEPEVAAGDTLLRGTVLSLADRIVRFAELSHRPFVDDGSVAGACMAERGAFANMAVLCRPPDDWDAVRASLDALVPTGAPLLVMSPWPTPDLRTCGYALLGHAPFMVRPAGGGPNRLPSDIDVLDVLDATGLSAFERTLLEGYPMHDIDAGYFTEALLGGDSHFFLGLVAGDPVAVAASHVSHGVHQVEFVATLHSHRGRGYGGAVTWAASSVDPSLPAVLIASDGGRPVYERLGYLSIARWTLWLRAEI